MAEFYGYVPTAAAQEAAYSVVASHTAESDGGVGQERVLDRMAERGYDGEETRRALQQLLADEAIRIEDDSVLLGQDGVEVG